MKINLIYIFPETDKKLGRSNRKSKMHGYGIKNKTQFIMGSFAN